MGRRRLPPHLLATRELQDDLIKLMNIANAHSNRVRVGTPHYAAFRDLCSAVTKAHRAVFGDGPPPWAATCNGPVPPPTLREP